MIYPYNEKNLGKVMKEKADWLKRDRFYCASIMYDTEDRTIWCDTFLSENDSINYKSHTIHNLSMSCYARGMDTRKEDLIEVIKILEEEDNRKEEKTNEDE